MPESQKILTRLYKQWSGEEASTLTQLPLSGSDRRYYRMIGPESQAIGAWNADVFENKAFLKLADHFASNGLPVPEVYLTDESQKAYLQTDLGDTHLFGLLTAEGLSEHVKGLYRQVIGWLPHFQMAGQNGFDFSICYPRSAFDRQSMHWDLNYFKYYFVRLSGETLNEQALEDDFDRLITFLLQAKQDYFLYRDFQSRNVMVVENRPFFIDFQGGRQGPLQYDLASLLFDAKANLPNSFREELLEMYLEKARIIPGFDKHDFLKYYYGFVLIRILQALGAYGFRGFYQKKEHFLQSIPYALDNIDYVLEHHHPGIEFPELEKLLRTFVKSESLRAYAKPMLKVRVSSFSYREGIPADHSGNGGGFVFDCRALNNPGRLTEYKSLSGKDAAVKQFLANQSETATFLASVYNLVDQAVENYMHRGFENLMVSFGCTGGQHRSVYCADKLAAHLNQRYGLAVEAEHLSGYFSKQDQGKEISNF